MSQDMAITQEELGGEPGVNIVSGQDGASLPPLRLRFGWSPTDQMATLVIGNAGLKFPMTADTAKASGYCGPGIAPRDWRADHVTRSPACAAIGAARIQDDTAPVRCARA